MTFLCFSRREYKRSASHGWRGADRAVNRHVNRGALGYGRCTGSTRVAVRLAALALLLEHAAFGESGLSVRVCLPEECGRAVRAVRAACAVRAATRLTTDVWTVDQIEPLELSRIGSCQLKASLPQTSVSGPLR